MSRADRRRVHGVREHERARCCSVCAREARDRTAAREPGAKTEVGTSGAHREPRTRGLLREIAVRSVERRESNPVESSRFGIESAVPA
jgi:hypothetical protein